MPKKVDSRLVHFGILYLAAENCNCQLFVFEKSGTLSFVTIWPFFCKCAVPKCSLQDVSFGFIKIEVK